MFQPALLKKSGVDGGGGVSPELFSHSIDELVVLLKTLISRHPSEFG